MAKVSIFISATIFGLSLIFTIQLSYYIQTLGIDSSGLQKSLYFLVTCNVILFFVAIIKKLTPIRNFISFAFCTWLFVEFLLHSLGYFTLIPRLDDTHNFVPYGNSYTIKEGGLYSTMNRYGWHAIDQELSPSKHKIALIGDSYVHAYSVPVKQHMGVHLASLFEGRDTQVFQFGESGAGPAQYLEYIKYAKSKYNIDEAVILFTLGNDYRNLLIPLQKNDGYHPGTYEFYELHGNNEVRLHPHAFLPIRDFNNTMWKNHQSLFFNLHRSLRSHLYSVKIPRFIWLNLKNAKRIEERASRHLTPNGNSPSLDDFIYLSPKKADYLHALQLTKGILSLTKNWCKKEGVALKVVSIPHFPEPFYRRGEMSLVIGDYNYLQPEEDLENICRQLDLPLLSMGKHMLIDLHEADQIKPLYTGHLSSAGHEYFAKAIHTRYYKNKSQ